MSVVEPVLSYDELAVIFRRSRSHIANTINGWIKSRHFPPSLPGSKPRLWSAARVKEWVDAPDNEARASIALRVAAAYGSGEVPEQVVLDHRSNLERRYRRAA